MIKRILKLLGWIVATLIVLIVVLVIYVRSVASIEDPEISISNDSTEVLQSTPGFFTYKGSWFRQSESGLYELYVEGDPAERGVAIGKLTKDLIQYQEMVFNDQIHQLVPSRSYLNVLKYFVGWFNRDLDDHVAEEFRREIYGVSRAASHEFDDIAPPYQRILNYHAAHDIGHALQNMALVGCTAFATWGEQSKDGSIIIGRNFDFYVGDDFAKNKIIAFYKPDKGHKFMMVTFGGMTGVLSGMNEHGLTITLNAAKSEIPSGSATPVSILAREILQYASTIEEAYQIAKSRQTFVAEAFMIGSAKDRRVAIIEKSPEAIDLFESKESYIIGTNHYQSKLLGTSELNREHMRTSASVYRHDRVKQMLLHERNSIYRTAEILRDRRGMNDENIGLGNEKAINQLIAHHGIIFQPEERKVWVSTDPWQLGRMVCYDLDSVFKAKAKGQEIVLSESAIDPDPFLMTNEYAQALKFNQFRFPFQPRQQVHPDSLISWNPMSYHAYMLAGDIYFEQDDYQKAADAYKQGLRLEIATIHERDHMKERLEDCIAKMK